jgi:formylglycine-generating enzyme required for sulfatase activity
VRETVLAAVCVVGLGCQPTSEIIVHVDTDAPVPVRAGAPPDPTRPAWLFDRLRVDVLAGGQPVPGGRRDFEVDEGLFADGRVSFGVAPRVDDGSVTVRLRLFRGDHALGGEPRPGATLDTTLALPSVDASAVAHVTAHLHVEDVGRALGVPDPLVPDVGPPGPSEVGSWPGARVVPCTSAPRPGEACIPGGAYWMGDPIIRGYATGQDADRERLVVLSPFFVQLHEVTVDDVRAHYPQLQNGGFLPADWNGSSDPNTYDSWCTYTQMPIAADPTDVRHNAPANCVDFESAERYCKVIGGDLPTEAQWEFVASGRGAERAYPWGGDDPSCFDAVWGRGGLGLTLYTATDCRADENVQGPLAIGKRARDRVPVTDASGGVLAEIVDLGGNVSEWTRDYFLTQDDDYWSQPGVYLDPVVTTHDPATVTQVRVIRGGNWVDPPIFLRAGERRPATQRDSVGYYVFYEVGFRCVRPGL